MLVHKSYVARIDANHGKEKILNSMLDDMNRVSEYFFSLPELLADSKESYRLARIMTSHSPSKVTQNFIRVLKSKKDNGKLKRAMKSGLYLDQNFKFVITKNKYTNYWIKFNKTYFPLIGKHLKKNIEDPSNIKFAQIFKRKNIFYCRLVYEKDINTNDFKYINKKDLNSTNPNDYIKKYIHKTDVNVYGKKFVKSSSLRSEIHKLTSLIRDDLKKKRIDVLYLEGRESFVKSTFEEERVNGKNLRKKFSYFPYSLFSNILRYKCLETGIGVFTSEFSCDSHKRSQQETIIKKTDFDKHSKTMTSGHDSPGEQKQFQIIKRTGCSKDYVFNIDKVLPYKESIDFSNASPWVQKIVLSDVKKRMSDVLESKERLVPFTDIQNIKNFNGPTFLMKHWLFDVMGFNENLDKVKELAKGIRQTVVECKKKRRVDTAEEYEALFMEYIAQKALLTSEAVTLEGAGLAFYKEYFDTWMQESKEEAEDWLDLNMHRLFPESGYSEKCWLDVINNIHEYLEGIFRIMFFRVLKAYVVLYHVGSKYEDDFLSSLKTRITFDNVTTSIYTPVRFIDLKKFYDNRPYVVC